MPMRSKRYDSPLAPQKLAASADQFANPVPIPSANLAMFPLRSVLLLYSLFVPAQDRQRKISEKVEKRGASKGNETAPSQESTAKCQGCHPGRARGPGTADLR